MQQHFGETKKQKMQRNKEKEGMENGKKYKKRSRKIKWLKFTNELINTFFESSRDEVESNVN